MKPSVLSRDSLAARYTRIAAALAVATTVLLGATSAVGVYRVVSKEQQARIGAYCDVLALEVSSHLQTAYRIVRALADRGDLQSASPQQARTALGVALLDNGPYLEHLTLAEASGTVVSSYPASQGPTRSQVQAWIAALARSGSRSEWIVDDGGLFIVSQLRPGGAGDRVLIAQVQMERIDATLDQIASTSRSPIVFIRQPDGRVLSAGGAVAQADLQGLRMERKDADGRRRVLLPSTAKGTYRGVSGRVTGVPGIAWEVVALEPSTAALSETWGALRPAIVAYVVLMVLAVIVAIAAFSWLVRPLRTLEARARAAAQGAVLEPVAVDRGDEVGRLLESFNLVTMRLNRLQEAIRLLAKTEEAGQVADNVVQSVIHLVGLCDPAVYLVEADGSEPARLRLAAARGPLERALGSVVALTDAERDALLGSGEARTMREALGERFGSKAGSSAAGDAVTLGIPLRASRGVVGLLAVTRAGGRPFSAAEVDLLGSFAAQAALALEKARSFEEQRLAREEAETLQRAAQLLFEESDLSWALEEVAARAADALGMTWRLAWLDAATVLGRERCAPAPQVETLLSILEPDNDMPEDGLEAVSGVKVLTAEEDPLTARWLQDAAIQVAVIAYAKLAGRVTGLIGVGAGDQGSRPDQRCLRIVEALGRQMALALERARLFHEAEERAASLETMFRVSQAVSSSLQVNVVLGRVLDVVQKILNADAVILMRWEDEKKQLAVPMARGVLDRQMLEQRFAPGEDLPGAVLQTQQPMLLADLSRVGGKFARAAEKVGLRSALLVPLVARGRAIGVLVTLGRRAAAFDKGDADLLSTFASHAALAIDTANLFSREHEVSHVLQSSILPMSLPQVEGVELSAAYVPAGAAAQIGGDYYDVFQAPDGRVVLVIADVCGKGVQAATKTSMIRFTVRGMVAAGAEPGRILESLNRMVLETGDPHDIFTIWLGMLDVQTGVLSWADGGHPPGLLMQRSTGSITRLGTTGPLVGALRDARYEERRVRLSRGDRLLLYTDGVSETRREGKLFGEGRIRRVLQREKDVRSVPESMLAELQRFAGGQVRDDVAILAAGYVGINGFEAASELGKTNEKP